MKLTSNFTLEEFIYSKTAEKLKISNKPNEYEIKNIKNLVQKLMQPLRDYFQKPITITSGFRCEKLNSAVYGAPNSQHRFGEACDFIIKGIDNKKVCEYILKNMMFDQLILEPSWIHVSYSNKNRQEYLIAK